MNITRGQKGGIRANRSNNENNGLLVDPAYLKKEEDTKRGETAFP
jgi:hypothetical protein